MSYVWRFCGIHLWIMVRHGDYHLVVNLWNYVCTMGRLCWCPSSFHISLIHLKQVHRRTADKFNGHLTVTSVQNLSREVPVDDLSIHDLLVPSISQPCLIMFDYQTVLQNAAGCWVLPEVMRKVNPMAKPILPIMANGEVHQWPRRVLCNLQRSGHIAGGFLTDGRRCFRCPCSRKSGHSNSQTLEEIVTNPIGSMYAIYGNIYHQYIPKS